jgi:hypothetical protein
MTRWLITGAGVVVMSGWLGITAFGQAPDSKAQNVATEKGKEASAAPVAILRQAGELVHYARENESPVAMLAAVQMIQRVRVQDAAGRVKQGQSGAAAGSAAGAAGQKGKTPAPTLDAKVLLAEARTWAKGNQSLVALIDEAAKAQPATGTLGSVIGPIRQPGRADARTYYDWSVTMRGGELARIAVLGDGDTDLDLEVFDENGNLIARDIDLTDQCVVSWTPRWTGAYRVRITNLGYIYNNYLMLSN